MVNAVKNIIAQPKDALKTVYFQLTRRKWRVRGAVMSFVWISLTLMSCCHGLTCVHCTFVTESIIWNNKSVVTKHKTFLIHFTLVWNTTVQNPRTTVLWLANLRPTCSVLKTKTIWKTTENVNAVRQSIVQSLNPCSMLNVQPINMLLLWGCLNELKAAMC